MRALALLLFVPALLEAGKGADLLASLRDVTLDPSECYRVREINIARDEAQFYFTDGYLIFAKPIGSTRTTAIFSAAAEGGEAELLMLPPSHGERRALAAYTGSPNLEEHFNAAIMIFAGDTYRELQEQIAANPYNKKSGEMGALLADKWSPQARSLTASFATRLAADLLSPAERRRGLFAAALAGRELGTFDLVFDPRVPEQIIIGGVSKNGFEVWSSFASRSYRAHPFAPELTLSNYRIDSTLDPDLTLHCVTKVEAQLAGAEGALPFEISSQMKITSALIDSSPAEVLASADAALNSIFLLVPATPLDPARPHQIEIHHEGKVISDAGNQVYFVGSRGSWYPGRGLQFSTYDLTFRSPRELDLVSTGDQIEDRVEQGQRITHRKAAVPIRFAGFNLGVYDRAQVVRGPLTIEVCANRAVEEALQPRVPDLTWTSTVAKRGHAIETVTPMPPPRVHTSKARLEALASDLGDVMDFYAARFGPLALRHLEVSPVPGRFGQGFPGMIYLSTISYLQVPSLNERQQVFFSDLLDAHEAAHQWWGSIVTSAGYHDDWLTEALANYSALLYLEKRKGPKAVDLVLEDYRTKLLAKGTDGNTMESAGPIVQGMRLGEAWTAVVYGKGTWIVHMLRKRLGEEAFARMLMALRKNFEDQTITTEQFRLFCSTFLPPKAIDPKLEDFFDQWVYGTGIPTLKLTYKVQGLRISGTVTAQDYNGAVPIQVQSGARTETKFVRAGAEPELFQVQAPGPGGKAFIDLKGILHQ